MKQRGIMGAVWGKIYPMQLVLKDEVTYWSWINVVLQMVNE